MSTPSLVIAHGFDCGPIRVEVAYTPVTDVPHVSGRAAGDPFRDVFEIRLVDRGLPEGTVFDYQHPTPLQFFWSVLRKRKDDVPLDLTAPQIDAHHTGRPRPETRSFTRAGETLTEPVSYFGLATIVPDEEIVPGEYLVRLRSYEMITVGSTPCTSEAVEMPITIRSVRSP